MVKKPKIIPPEEALMRLKNMAETAIKVGTEMKKTIAATQATRPKQWIKIVDYGALPTDYYLRPAVLDAVFKEVEKDVLEFNKPLPPGAELHGHVSVTNNPPAQNDEEADDGQTA